MTPTTQSLEQFAEHDLAVAIIDEWCKARAEKVSERGVRHLKGGGSLNAPNYRAMLGEHCAYMAVRSFIHGALHARRSPHPTGGSQ